MNRTTGNIFGGLSIFISLFLWSFALFANMPDFSIQFERFLIALGFFSMSAPIVAAWYGAKWWLLMLLSPLTLYVFFAPAFHL